MPHASEAGGSIHPHQGDVLQDSQGALSGALQVHGYVKNVGRAGAFVALARGLEARVKLANLADGYVKEPEQAFPEGQLVRGRVMSTAGGRCASRELS